jgi:hypothetical protein
MGWCNACTFALGLERCIDADLRGAYEERVVPSLDLGAYLERIGWRGEVPVTLETLSRLIRAHMSSIAFENLDVLLGRPVRLDLDASKRSSFADAVAGIALSMQSSSQLPSSDSDSRLHVIRPEWSSFFRALRRHARICS